MPADHTTSQMIVMALSQIVEGLLDLERDCREESYEHIDAARDIVKELSSIINAEHQDNANP